MKKFLAFLLAALLLCLPAAAFAQVSPTLEELTADFGYSVQVIKYALVTKEKGLYDYIPANSAQAANGVDVYWAVRLEVRQPSQAVRDHAVVEIQTTALGNVPTSVTIPVGDLETGAYYYSYTGQEPGCFREDGFYAHTWLGTRHISPTPVLSGRCLDTETVRVTAQVSVEIPLGDAFQVGPYDVTIADGPDGVAQRIITFRETAQSNLVAGMFLLDNKSIVTDFIASSADYADAFQEADTQAPAFAPGAGESLLAWLGGGDAAGLQDSIANGTMCMSDENIAQAFGFSFQDEATITWEAATKPLFTSG